MATVRKRSWTTEKGERKEAWRVRYVDQHGKTRTRQFARKANAEAWRIKSEGEVAAGVHTPDSASVTVAAAADIWLAAAREGGCDRGTLKSYAEVVNLHIKPLIGSEKLSRLTSPRVIDFRSELLATRSFAMAKKGVRHLSMVLAEAMRRGLVAQNVATKVTVRRPRQEEQRLAEQAEIPARDHLRALVEAADRMANEDPRIPVLIRVVMLTGLRSSELRGFAWAGADLKAPSLRVSQRADRWNVIGPPKSTAGTRTIPIGPGLAQRLREWRLRCPPTELGLMFPNARGGVIDQKGMTALFLKVQIAAGLAIDTGRKDAKGATIWRARYGLHDLRHAAASFWISRGIDFKRLQLWIGHENIQLTIDVYGHLVVDQEKDAELAGGAEAALLA
jgi:integrase